MKLAKLIIPCLLMLAMSASSVKAQNGLGGPGLAYLYGYNGFGGCNSGVYNRSVPYFALHPPVYYGKRYTRPYGASPFAAWPQLQAASSYAPSPQATRSLHRPAVVINPYAPTSVSPQTFSQTPGVVNVAPVAPKVIENPYYRGDVQFTSALER